MTVKIAVQDALKTYEYEIPVMEWLHLKRKLEAMNKQSKSDLIRKECSGNYGTWGND